MASFTGIIVTSPIALPEDSGLFDSMSDPQVTVTGVVYASNIDGVLNNNQPVEMLPRNHGGNILGSFEQIWYDTIHFIPSTTILLGSVSANSVVEFEVWNAYDVNNTLASISEVDAIGLTLSGQPTPPDVYQGLASKTYSLEVSGEGPVIIDAVYTWTFDGDIVELNVKGRRSIVFAHQPNWAKGVRESIRWNTNVLEAYDGTEQRIQIKASPEILLSYEVITHDYEMRELDSQLHMWQAEVFTVPIWSDYHKLTAELPISSTVIPNLTLLSGQDYKEGGQIIFWQAWDVYEIANIETIGASSVTLSRATDFTWGVGTIVMPVRACRMSKQATAERFHSNLSRLPVQFISDDIDLWIDEVEGSIIYQGTYSVLEGEPNRVDSQKDTYSRKIELLNPGTGRVFYEDTRTTTRLDRSFQWMLQDRSKILELKTWLAFRRGKLKPAWVPTWQNDLVLAETLSQGGTAAHFEQTEYETYYNLAEGRRDIRVELLDGTIYYRRITAVSLDPDTHMILTMDTAFPEDIIPANIRIISFMGLHRLSQDTVELQWHTPDVLTISTNMRLLDE